MEDIKLSFEVNTSNFELMKRLDDLCEEFNLSRNLAIEIALDRLLDDFNQIVAITTCRGWVNKDNYTKPKSGELF